MKLSSESAEYISVTPVVARDLPVRELIETMLGMAGKDAGRIRDLLLRGSLVSGASRLRWEGFQAEPREIEAVLASFPDPEPERAFVASRCVRAVLRGQRAQIDVPREAGEKRRPLRRTSLWDILLGEAAAGNLRYVEYSYKERADRYRLELSSEAMGRLRGAAGLAAYTVLERQLRTLPMETIDFLAGRE